jgi:L,D-transpeptidase ErfK/SrfK
MRSLAILFSTLLTATLAQATTWILPPSDIDIFGQIEVVAASREETLLDIARRYGIGQDAILLANPLVDRWLPPDGAPVVIPARHIFPQAERTGLVINLPEMRLYYFPKPEKGKKPVVITYPISILPGYRLNHLRTRLLQQVIHRYRISFRPARRTHWAAMLYIWVRRVI